MARLEAYSEGARGQALLVNAAVDGELEVVLVFKVSSTSTPAVLLPGVHSLRTPVVTVSQGFSSSLSGRTAPEPAMSVLPERAVIQTVDVVEGPFDPSNIEYIEKDVPWEEFKSRLQ
jgi:hypothetical protein